MGSQVGDGQIPKHGTRPAAADPAEFVREFGDDEGGGSDGVGFRGVACDALFTKRRS